ncbi:MAG: GTPase Era [Angelakisella sp.]|jgi:GTP-binding protein Era|nr:GTPase Era [Angelakisella sp.]
MIQQTTPAGSRSAFVALVGKPNVGKSSLLNRLVGEKVAIVTQKPQTTRTRITGVLTKGETQLVFIDTPGLLKAKDALGRYMVKQVNDSVADVDLAVLVTEPGPELSKADGELIESFKRLGLPAIAVVNKIDTLEEKEKLLPKMAALGSAYDFRHIIPISALTGEGVDTLLEVLLDSAQEGVHFFPDDALTDQPERVLCAEMIREQILLHMREEIPHGVAVVVEEMKDRPLERCKDNVPMVDISAMIYCERDGHKGMLIGKGGQMLKAIATAARQSMEDFLGVKVNLQCRVKTKEAWKNNEQQLRNFGFR